MKLVLPNAGSYPRIGETPELQLLRRTQAALDRKESTPETLHAAEGALVKAALREREEAGIDVLRRSFDTNFSSRQPVAKGEIKAANGRALLAEYEFAKSNSAKPVKPVLTGPLTLARHTLVEHP